jgi:hypothetical protein
MIDVDTTAWTTQDGHRYTSVPTEVPRIWERGYAMCGLTYVSAGREYEILKTRNAYALYRNGRPLVLGTYYRLKDAKARAVTNAQGLDVWNIA